MNGVMAMGAMVWMPLLLLLGFNVCAILSFHFSCVLDDDDGGGGGGCDGFLHGE